MTTPMTTPAAHVPRTVANYRRLLPHALAALAVVVAIVLALTLSVGSDETPATQADNLREWTRTETIDHLVRINGLAGTGSAAGSSVATHEVTRDDVLDRLYRINGVMPADPDVPSTVR